MATIFLVRHGQTDWNVSGQIMGARPVPLNPTGELQAQRLALFLKIRPVGAIYSSPVARALQTAEILASTQQLPVMQDAGLAEIGVGEWEGQFWKDLADEIVRRNFYSMPHEARPPGGETIGEVQARAVEAVERARADQPGGPLVFVSHADVVRTILAHYLQLDFQRVRQMRIDHASLSVLEFNGTLVDLLCLNYTPDLAGLP
jgi:broad specificity phosphatase PhoE